ncbi:MAG: glycosyltransferase [FCB group bacterium]|jgi:glycosyltransferase involved in cell wall biosynthesis
MGTPKGLNILFTSAHFPYPLIGGERVKEYNIIRHLAQNNRVILVCLDRGYEVKPEYLDEMKKINVEPYYFHINNFNAMASAAAFTPFGKPLESNFFRHSQFRNKILDIVSNNRIDLIINFFIRTAEHVKDLKIKKMLMAEDCRSFYQYQTFKASKNLRQRIVRSYEAGKLRKYEAEIMNHYDITTVVTEEDYRQMRELNSIADIRILMQGVDTELFCPPEHNSIRKDMLFIGKLDVWTNILMVRKIIHEIFPYIHEKNPDAKLLIVGANPVKEILKEQNENIIIHANVVDIVPYLQNAVVFLHPHEGGSGIQNKVLEAMSCACPIITTKSGTNGIGIQSGINGFIAENISNFIRYTLDLLNSSELRYSIGINARKYILENHTWEPIFTQLDEIISELIF